MISEQGVKGGNAVCYLYGFTTFIINKIIVSHKVLRVQMLFVILYLIKL